MCENVYAYVEIEMIYDKNETKKNYNNNTENQAPKCAYNIHIETWRKCVYFYYCSTRVCASQRFPQKIKI